MFCTKCADKSIEEVGLRKDNGSVNDCTVFQGIKDELSTNIYHGVKVLDFFRRCVRLNNFRVVTA